MKSNLFVRLLFFIILGTTSVSVFSATTREERRLIVDGNKLYVGRKYKDAASKYQQALGVNPESAVAKYNLGMAEIRQVTNPKDTTEKNIALLENATKRLTEVASMAADRPGLAAKANYNLGNLSFNREDFASAINYYKNALRIDPKDEKARKNLRIAQLKQQNQNKDQDKDKENKEQDQNRKNQDQQKDNERDQQDSRDEQNKQNQEKEEKGKINNQTASQILQAIDNKESQTRARVNRANKGEKSESAGRRSRKW